MLKIKKSKAATLAALYNESRPLGLGMLHYTPEPMTEAQAAELLERAGSHPYFDYLKGRVMKIDLSKDEFNPALYDRDNGQGAAERALSAIAE